MSSLILPKVRQVHPAAVALGTGGYTQPKDATSVRRNVFDIRDPMGGWESFKTGVKNVLWTESLGGMERFKNYRPVNDYLYTQRAKYDYFSGPNAVMFRAPNGRMLQFEGRNRNRAVAAFEEMYPDAVVTENQVEKYLKTQMESYQENEVGAATHGTWNMINFFLGNVAGSAVSAEGIALGAATAVAPPIGVAWAARGMGGKVASFAATHMAYGAAEGAAIAPIIANEYKKYGMEYTAGDAVTEVVFSALGNLAFGAGAEGVSWAVRKTMNPTIKDWKGVVKKIRKEAKQARKQKQEAKAAQLERVADAIQKSNENVPPPTGDTPQEVAEGAVERVKTQVNTVETYEKQGVVKVTTKESRELIDQAVAASNSMLEKGDAGLLDAVDLWRKFPYEKLQASKDDFSRMREAQGRVQARMEEVHLRNARDRVAKRSEDENLHLLKNPTNLDYEERIAISELNRKNYHEGMAKHVEEQGAQPGDDLARRQGTPLPALKTYLGHDDMLRLLNQSRMQMMRIIGDRGVSNFIRKRAIEEHARIRQQMAQTRGLMGKSREESLIERKIEDVETYVAQRLHEAELNDDMKNRLFWEDFQKRFEANKEEGQAHLMKVPRPAEAPTDNPGLRTRHGAQVRGAGEMSDDELSARIDQDYKQYEEREDSFLGVGETGQYVGMMEDHYRIDDEGEIQDGLEAANVYAGESGMANGELLTDEFGGVVYDGKSGQFEKRATDQNRAIVFKGNGTFITLIGAWNPHSPSQRVLFLTPEDGFANPEVAQAYAIQFVAKFHPRKPFFGRAIERAYLRGIEAQTRDGDNKIQIDYEYISPKQMAEARKFHDNEEQLARDRAVAAHYGGEVEGQREEAMSGMGTATKKNIIKVWHQGESEKGFTQPGMPKADTHLDEDAWKAGETELAKARAHLNNLEAYKNIRYSGREDDSSNEAYERTLRDRQPYFEGIVSTTVDEMPQGTVGNFLETVTAAMGDDPANGKYLEGVFERVAQEIGALDKVLDYPAKDVKAFASGANRGAVISAVGARPTIKTAANVDWPHLFHMRNDLLMMHASNPSNPMHNRALKGLDQYFMEKLGTAEVYPTWGNNVDFKSQVMTKIKKNPAVDVDVAVAVEEIMEIFPSLPAAFFLNTGRRKGTSGTSGTEDVSMYVSPSSRSDFLDGFTHELAHSLLNTLPRESWIKLTTMFKDAEIVGFSTKRLNEVSREDADYAISNVHEWFAHMFTAWAYRHVPAFARVRVHEHGGVSTDPDKISLSSRTGLLDVPERMNQFFRSIVDMSKLTESINLEGVEVKRIDRREDLIHPLKEKILDDRIQQLESLGNSFENSDDTMKASDKADILKKQRAGGYKERAEHYAIERQLTDMYKKRAKIRGEAEANKIDRMPTDEEKNLEAEVEELETKALPELRQKMRKDSLPWKERAADLRQRVDNFFFLRTQRTATRPPTLTEGKNKVTVKEKGKKDRVVEQGPSLQLHGNKEYQFWAGKMLEFEKNINHLKGLVSRYEGEELEIARKLLQEEIELKKEFLAKDRPGTQTVRKELYALMDKWRRADAQVSQIHKQFYRDREKLEMDIRFKKKRLMDMRIERNRLNPDDIDKLRDIEEKIEDTRQRYEDAKKVSAEIDDAYDQASSAYNKMFRHEGKLLDKSYVATDIETGEELGWGFDKFGTLTSAAEAKARRRVEKLEGKSRAEQEAIMAEEQANRRDFTDRAQVKQTIKMVVDGMKEIKFQPEAGHLVRDGKHYRPNFDMETLATKLRELKIDEDKKHFPNRGVPDVANFEELGFYNMKNRADQFGERAMTAYDLAVAAAREAGVKQAKTIIRQMRDTHRLYEEDRAAKNNKPAVLTTYPEENPERAAQYAIEETAQTLNTLRMKMLYAEGENPVTEDLEKVRLLGEEQAILIAEKAYWNSAEGINQSQTATGKLQERLDHLLERREEMLYQKEMFESSKRVQGVNDEIHRLTDVIARNKAHDKIMDERIAALGEQIKKYQEFYDQSMQYQGSKEDLVAEVRKYEQQLADEYGVKVQVVERQLEFERQQMAEREERVSRSYYSEESIRARWEKQEGIEDRVAQAEADTPEGQEQLDKLRQHAKETEEAYLAAKQKVKDHEQSEVDRTNEMFAQVKQNIPEDHDAATEWHRNFDNVIKMTRSADFDDVHKKLKDDVDKTDKAKLNAKKALDKLVTKYMGPDDKWKKWKKDHSEPTDVPNNAEDFELYAVLSSTLRWGVELANPALARKAKKESEQEVVNEDGEVTRGEAQTEIDGLVGMLLNREWERYVDVKKHIEDAEHMARELSPGYKDTIEAFDDAAAAAGDKRRVFRPTPNVRASRPLDPANPDDAELLAQLDKVHAEQVHDADRWRQFLYRQIYRHERAIEKSAEELREVGSVSGRSAIHLKSYADYRSRKLAIEEYREIIKSGRGKRMSEGRGDLHELEKYMAYIKKNHEKLWDQWGMDQPARLLLDDGTEFVPKKPRKTYTKKKRHGAFKRGRRDVNLENMAGEPIGTMSKAQTGAFRHVKRMTGRALEFARVHPEFSGTLAKGVHDASIYESGRSQGKKVEFTQEHNFLEHVVDALKKTHTKLSKWNTDTPQADKDAFLKSEPMRIIQEKMNKGDLGDIKPQEDMKTLEELAAYFDNPARPADPATAKPQKKEPSRPPAAQEVTQARADAEKAMNDLREDIMPKEQQDQLREAGMKGLETAKPSELAGLRKKVDQEVDKLKGQGVPEEQATVKAAKDVSAAHAAEKARAAEIELADSAKFDTIMIDMKRRVNNANAQKRRVRMWEKKKQGKTKHQPSSVFIALMSFLAPDEWGVGDGPSLDSYVKSTYKEVYAIMPEFIEAVRVRYGYQQDHDFIQEVFRGVIDGDHVKANPSLTKYVEEIQNVIAYLGIRFNEAGGNIQMREDYAMFHSHDRAKIEKAGFDQWKADVLRLHDPSRFGLAGEEGADMTNPFDMDKLSDHDESMRQAAVAKMKDGNGNPKYTDDKIDKMLRYIYDEMVNPESSEARMSKRERFTGNEEDERKSMGQWHQNRRIIHFKDADSWLEYQQKYGSGSMLETFISNVHKRTVEISMIEFFGTDPDKAWENLLTQAKRLGETDRDPLGGWEEESLKATVEHIMATVNEPRRQMPHRFFRALRQLDVARHMGMAVLSAIFGDRITSAIAAHVKGIPQMENLWQFAKNAVRLGKLGDDDRRTAMELMLGGEAHIGAIGTNTRFSEMLGSGVTGKMADFLIRASGLAHLTRASKEAFAVTMSGQYAKHRHLEFEQLNRRLQYNLKEVGINKAGWNKIRKNATREFRGVVMIDPGEIEDARLRAAWNVMLDDAAELAVPSPNTKTQRLIVGRSRPGSFEGEMRRSMGQYWSYSIQIYNMMRYIYTRPESAMERTTLIGSMVVGLTMAGAVVVMMKEVLAGRDPPSMDDKRFWLQAMKTGGAGSVVGEFLFKDAQEAPMSWGLDLLGPVGSLGQDMLSMSVLPLLEGTQDRGGSFGRTAGKIVGDWTPYNNLFYIKPFMDNLVKYGIEHFFTGRVQRPRRGNKYGNKYYWKRGDIMPSRAPSF